MNLYDTKALHKQNMNEDKQAKLLEFYKEVFSGYSIRTIHDCSIGAGGSTLPLAKLGYKVSGSDINQSLLDKAKENFESEGYKIELFRSDFESLSSMIDGTYDCIISTGNSLPHVSNEEVRKFVETISTKIDKNGLLLIDTRNWDKILDEKPIFTAKDPLIMNESNHTSVYQIWNWHDDQSVDFIFVTSKDKNGKHEGSSLAVAPKYYPLKFKDYEKILSDNGFVIKKCYDVDYLWLDSQAEDKTGDFCSDFSKINWYAVLAEKTSVID